MFSFLVLIVFAYFSFAPALSFHIQIFFVFCIYDLRCFSFATPRNYLYSYKDSVTISFFFFFLLMFFFFLQVALLILFMLLYSSFFALLSSHFFFSDLFFNFLFLLRCPVTWDCRIHRLRFCWWVRPPPNKSPRYNTKNLMLKFK